MNDKLKGFVLSTGRTGTVSITELLNTAKDIFAVHEPTPSRRFHFFSRFYFEKKLNENYILNSYFRNRKKLLSNLTEENYIEVNLTV